MQVIFSSGAWADYLLWRANDRQILRRINRLINDIARDDDPASGIGKPEILRHNYSGYLSRRITDEHRLVYVTSVKDGEIEVLIASCRYHYSK